MHPNPVMRTPQLWTSFLRWRAALASTDVLISQPPECTDFAVSLAELDAIATGAQPPLINNHSIV